MKLTFYPSTKTGVFAITFMIMAVVLMVVVAYLGRDLKAEQDESFFDQMNLVVMTVAAFLCSILSLITGLLSVVRDKERSVLCIGTIFLGFLSVFYGTSVFLGELNLYNLQTK